MGITNSRDKALIILSAIVLIFVLLSVFSGVWDSEKKITDISLSGAIIMPENDLKDSIRKKIINKSKKEINLESIENDLLKEKYVKSAIVGFEGNSELAVEISERIPVGILADNLGQLHYFDDEGIILPFTFKYNLEDILLVKDIYFTKSSVDILSGIADIIDKLNDDKYMYIKSKISDITYDYKIDSIVIRSKEKKNFIIGDRNNINEKLKNLNTFLNNEYIINNNKKNIDCRWSGMIVMKN